MRPYWSGQIRLALVSLPVKVYSASKSGARPSLHQIHAPSGKRIRYEKVVPGLGAVDPDDILMGYEYQKDNYLLLEPDELDELKIESRRTINLVQFVDAQEIDPIFFERPYYVVPDGELAEDGFIVIREALRRTGKVGLGQMAVRGAESIVALKPCGRGLLLETLRFADEVKAAAPIFAGIEEDEPNPELVAFAEELIQRKTGPFHADAFKDHYRAAFDALIEQKLRSKRGQKIASEEEPKGRNKGGAKIVDLMDALKASVHADGKRKAATPAKPQKRGSRGKAA
jgi:DNA end-binding protein Ku